MSPKYTIGTSVRVKNDLLTKTVMGVIIGIKLEEEKNEKVDSAKPVSESITRKYAYLLSGNSNSWYYEWSLVPLVDRLISVEKASDV